MDPLFALYGAALVAVVLVFALQKHRSERSALSAKHAAVEAGLTEPASLHPVIDRGRCLGCGACVKACPEGNVLGLIHGKAELIEPTSCIGHGACEAACPFDAISLVFGTEQRGVDLPFVGPDFQTNVPGLYIAGELGGMGLIANAIEQGRQAIEAISQRAANRSQALDVVIVGSGPAGIAASLAATARKLSYVTIEQESLGGTVAHYPRGKLVMTRPVKLPIIGRVRMRETSKEALLTFWRNVQKRTRAEHPLRRTGRCGGASQGRFRGDHQCRRLSRRCGAARHRPPRHAEKARRRRRAPAQGRLQSGRCRAVSRHGCARRRRRRQRHRSGARAGRTSGAPRLRLAYRGNAIGRAKPKNRDGIKAAIDSGRIRLLLETTVDAIEPSRVLLNRGGARIAMRNDAVIVCAGGILPTEFLRGMGIEISTKHGEA